MNHRWSSCSGEQRRVFFLLGCLLRPLFRVQGAAGLGEWGRGRSRQAIQLVQLRHGASGLQARQGKAARAGQGRAAQRSRKQGPWGRGLPASSTPRDGWSGTQCPPWPRQAAGGEHVEVVGCTGSTSAEQKTHQPQLRRTATGTHRGCGARQGDWDVGLADGVVGVKLPQPGWLPCHRLAVVLRSSQEEKCEPVGTAATSRTAAAPAPCHGSASSTGRQQQGLYGKGWEAAAHGGREAARRDKGKDERRRSTRQGCCLQVQQTLRACCSCHLPP